MAVIEILLPKMGESVAEATITKFVVNAGEQTEADEPLVEIARAATAAFPASGDGDSTDVEAPELSQAAISACTSASV